MSLSQSKILILGAAGYIGGTVLTNLLKEHDASKITVMVRKPEQKELFSNLGIQIVEGDVSDASLLKKLASEHDIVMNFAVAFGGDEASIQALVDGLEERTTKSQSKPVYLHTGGSGTVMYGANGEAGTDVWTVSRKPLALQTRTDTLQDEQYDRWDSLPAGSFFYGGYKV